MWEAAILVLTFHQRQVHATTCPTQLGGALTAFEDSALHLATRWPCGCKWRWHSMLGLHWVTVRAFTLCPPSPTPGACSQTCGPVENVTPTWQRAFAAGPHVHEHTVTLLNAPEALGFFPTQQRLTATWHTLGLTLDPKVSMHCFLHPKSLCSSLTQPTLRARSRGGLPQTPISKSYQLLLQNKQGKPQDETRSSNTFLSIRTQKVFWRQNYYF